jgi:hypothetical protein
MGIYDWEALVLQERVAQRHRETYLDMRIAHKYTRQSTGECKAQGPSRRYIKEYNKTLQCLLEESVGREQGEIRRRDVWESKRTV